MDAGQLNRKIVVKTTTATVDDAGGVSAIDNVTYIIWAKVESRSGALYSGQEQALWNYDYKVTFRYEKSRIVKSNATIVYSNKSLRINSISFEDEGNKKYCICRCSTVDNDV